MWIPLKDSEMRIYMTYLRDGHRKSSMKTDSRLSKASKGIPTVTAIGNWGTSPLGLKGHTMFQNCSSEMGELKYLSPNYYFLFTC